LSCLFPLKRYRDASGILITKEKLATGQPLWLPCGQCGECRLSRARQWATRCTHEATQWKNSSFITLTYKENPKTLCPEDTRNFIRRLREKKGNNFKYFLVGEYGENFDRPHYHALIFGYDFGYTKYKKIKDPKKEESSKEHELHNTDAITSSELDDIWALGYTSVGELTFDSAAYCAQYATKKINGSMAENHYQGRHPEFMRQSKNAIGKQYALHYAQEIIQHNSVMANGEKQPVPQYYLKQYEKQNYNLDKLKQKREEFSQDHSIQKSYVRAQNLNSKFNKKISSTDKLRVEYAKKLYLDNPDN